MAMAQFTVPCMVALTRASVKQYIETNNDDSNVKKIFLSVDNKASIKKHK